MTSKHKQDPKTGLIRQPLSQVILGGVFFFLVLAGVAAIHPHFSSFYMYISIPVGLLGFTSLIWINIRPNLYARFLLNLGISGLCVMIAFRAFGNLLPQFSFWGGAFIMSTTIFAHTLPLWSPSWASFVRDELSAPKTKPGKIVFRVSLLLFPFVGVLGALLEAILQREGKSKSLSLIFLMIFWFLAIGLPFAYRFPSSPWEGKRN